MGAGASATNGNTITTSTMNEEEVRAACGDKYDPFFFEALKNDDNVVFTTDFYRLLSSSTELEVCRLFITYSPKNNMNEQTFLTLLRDAKLLNKGLFSVRDAQKLFFKLKQEHESSSSRGISYKTWRHQALAEIASLKGLELDKLLQKLSHCEDLIVAIAQKREDQKVVEAPQNENKSPSPPSQMTSPLLGLRNVFTDVQKEACVKIQTAQRTKQAIIAAQRQKEIRSITSKQNEPIPLTVIEAGESSEIALVQLYHCYCPNGEISKKIFTTLLKDAGVYDKELTVYDAEFTFDRAKAKCLASGSQFQDQVLHNKRLTYQAFRVLLIPETATMKKLSPDRLIQVLVNALPIEQMENEGSTKMISTATATATATAATAAVTAAANGSKSTTSGANSAVKKLK